MGLFGNLFDFNGDGKLDTFEKTAEFAAFASMMDASKDVDEEEIDEQRDELEMSGLDVDELELMDDDERREALEDAGLDADDFDF